MKLLALDFEGSHKEPRRGCPVQLGIAVMEDGNVLDSAEWLIRPPLHYKTGKPTKEVDAYALRISGLSLDEIEAKGLTSLESCNELLAFVRKNDAGALPIVAYSFTYDAECYGGMLFDGGAYDFSIKEYLPYPSILGAKWSCALETARRCLNGKLIKYALDDVCKHLGYAREGATHGALEDAILAGRIVFDLSAKKAEQPALVEVA